MNVARALGKLYPYRVTGSRVSLHQILCVRSPTSLKLTVISRQTECTSTLLIDWENQFFLQRTPPLWSRKLVKNSLLVTLKVLDFPSFCGSNCLKRSAWEMWSSKLSFSSVCVFLQGQGTGDSWIPSGICAPKGEDSPPSTWNRRNFSLIPF